jgi:signal transduction histidine kinase/CheY-like chemotaxis protein
LRISSKIIQAFFTISVMTLPLRAAASSVTPAPYEQELATAKSLLMVKPEKAYAHAQSALAMLNLQRAGSDSKDVATAKWLSGEALTQLKKPERALPVLQQAFQEIEGLHSQGVLLGNVLLSRGRAEAALGAIKSALPDFQAAFVSFERANEKRGQATSLQEIGALYLQAREYSRALAYYDEARSDAGSSIQLRMAAQNNSGAALRELGRYRDAESTFSLALADANGLKNHLVAAHILTNIALTQLLQGRPLDARATISKGLALVSRDREANSERPFLLVVKANTFSYVGDYGSAGRLLSEAFSDVSRSATPEWRDAHELAAKVFEHLGQPEIALRHYEAFKRLDDEGTALAASTEAALMGARFDFANQSTKIAQLQTENLKRDAKLAKAQTRSTIVQCAILLVAVLVVSGLLLLLLIFTRRSRNKIKAVNTALADSNSALGKALNARTEFLAMTSHEIRTPLNGILGMAQVMLAEPAMSGELRDRLEIIKTSGLIMNDMLTDLLDIAKIEKGQFVIHQAEIDLLPFLAETTQMWSDKARTNNIEFELDSSNCPGRVVQDPSALRQILNNLLANAIKFTHDGGVRMVVGSSGSATDERLVFTISDSGIGIPSDKFASIFEAFSQVDSGTSRNYGGTGLGLAIVKNLVELLGGKISLESTPGVGTTFRVELPLIRAAVQSKDLAYRERASVLVVEDNRLSQAMFRSALKDQVRNLDFKNTVDDAVADVIAPIDVLVVDGACVQRHVAEDPRASVQTLHARFPNTPLVVLWPALTSDDTAYFRSIGVSQVLAKPVTISALVAAIDDVYRADNRALDEFTNTSALSVDRRIVGAK